MTLEIDVFSRTLHYLFFLYEVDLIIMKKYEHPEIFFTYSILKPLSCIVFVVGSPFNFRFSFSSPSRSYKGFLSVSPVENPPFF